MEKKSQTVPDHNVVNINKLLEQCRIENGPAVCSMMDRITFIIPACHGAIQKKKKK